MGMSCTQARLLSLTIRDNTIGRELNLCSLQKMALSNESTAISDEYTEAINNAKKLQWSNDSGATLYDISYDTLMSPSSLNCYEPYILTDAANGKVVVDDTYLKYAQMISETGAAGGNYEAHRTEILSNLTGISTEDLISDEVYKQDLQALYEQLNKKAAEEPELETTNAAELLANMGNVSSSAKTDKTGKAGDNMDVTSDTTWADIISTIGSGYNYVTYLGWDSSSSKANSKLETILEDFAKALTKVCGNYEEFDDDSISEAIENTVSLFTDEYAYDESQKHDCRYYAGENASDINTIAHQEDKKSNIFDGQNDAYAVSLTNLLNVFLINLLGDSELQNSLTTDANSAIINLEDYELVTTESREEYNDWKSEYDAIQDEINALEESYSNPIDAEEQSKIDFFDAIFYAIAEDGWTYNENINDSDYLNQLLQSGVYNITQAEQDSDGEWEYDTSAATTCQYVYSVTDNAAVSLATAEYEKGKTLINKKEEAIDTKMQKLETEQTSINEMEESYRSIIEENSDRTFDTFS